MRGEHTGVKKNGKPTFATRGRVKGGRSEGIGGSKALSFSTRVPRGIRARSARTYFAIFSRHAISGMTNGGCAPFYPSSIIPSSLRPSRSSLLSSLCHSLSLLHPSLLDYRQCRCFVLVRVECRVCARENRLPVFGEEYMGRVYEVLRRVWLVEYVHRGVHEFLNAPAFSNYRSFRSFRDRYCLHSLSRNQ